jgi:steroid delta-isomerase-like uncharacterized protein
MSEQNKAVVRRFIEEAWNNGNLDVVDELVAADHIDHDPARADAASGPAAMRAFIEMYRTAFPDTRIEFSEMVAEGDLVAGPWRATGTHQGELMGIPATGKPISITGMGMDRVVDGKIVESWSNWDAMGMMAQLGVIPAAAGVPA